MARMTAEQKSYCRPLLMAVQHGKCAICGDPNSPLTFEHVKPFWCGGSNERSNLILTCSPCNQKRGAKKALPNDRARTIHKAVVAWDKAERFGARHPWLHTA